MHFGLLGIFQNYRGDSNDADIVQGEFALARLAENRDDETGRHLDRVSEYCRLIAHGLRADGRYGDVLSDAWIEDLALSAPLHDIGKVSDEESELPHAILGMKLAEKAGERPDVLNAIGAHHDEIEMTSLISPIVQVCDAISGARPGARREVVESYIQRLKDLENIALEQPGVTQSYAIQAGRELRVMVESDQVNDEMAEQISFNISQRIMNEMTYPGQVKVTVIRETRAVSVAK